MSGLEALVGRISTTAVCGAASPEVLLVFVSTRMLPISVVEVPRANEGGADAGGGASRKLEDGSRGLSLGSSL